MFDKFLFLGLY